MISVTHDEVRPVGNLHTNMKLVRDSRQKHLSLMEVGVHAEPKCVHNITTVKSDQNGLFTYSLIRLFILCVMFLPVLPKYFTQANLLYGCLCSDI